MNAIVSFDFIQCLTGYVFFFPIRMQISPAISQKKTGGYVINRHGTYCLFVSVLSVMNA